jgi:hypothetical protein
MLKPAIERKIRSRRWRTLISCLSFPGTTAFANPMANKATDQGLRQPRPGGARYLAGRHLNVRIESCCLKACHQFCVHRLIPQLPSQESIVNGVIKVVDIRHTVREKGGSKITASPAAGRGRRICALHFRYERTTTSYCWTSCPGLTIADRLPLRLRSCNWQSEIEA